MLPWRRSAMAAGNYSGLSASTRRGRAGTQRQIVTPGQEPLGRGKADLTNHPRCQAGTSPMSSSPTV
ncbi:sister chromatid cohesion protein PDS5 [Sarotherodon galilaeus]